MACRFTARAAACLLVAVVSSIALDAQDYAGPDPPKADMPYLLRAGALIPTEVQQAKEEKRKKNEVAFVIPGAASPVKTPMAAPMFIFLSDKIPADTLQLFRLEVNGSNRELSTGGKKKDQSMPLRLSVTQLHGKLYRVEAYNSLDPGEYSLSPNSSNEAFCFSVY
ncbi:MAG TPA: hypothetical protein VHD76_06745 [Bryobacteraceae bacterium]|jgi:hypothetical protein|nr:hypothetical protein [Bryobacteraceae bacterium]